MDILLWVITGVAAAVIAALHFKIFLLHKSAREIEKAFADRLTEDTNTLIDISSRDRYMRSLANAINTQLRILREERHRFIQGDTELKNAVTNISHDLRTPLTAIYGYLDLLERAEKSDEVARYIDIIAGRAEMLGNLTEELFRYSVIIAAEQNGETEEVSLGGALEESLAAFYATLNKKGIAPTVTIPEKKIIRRLDPAALSRVFSNLLSNAVKYSDGDLEVVLYESGEISFTNTAQGLDEVEVGRLFDRFYTVEAARKGVGLGLSIARTLVLRMGGTIGAKYEKSRLTVTVCFPEKSE